MSITVYPREHEDGLSDRLANNRIAIAAAVYPSDFPPDVIVTRGRAIAAAKGSPDLFYMDSVLATAGTNKNDDVFTPDTLWAARKTPEDKPLNVEHNQADIVGHIVGVVPTDGKGDLLGEDTRNAEVPDDLRIVVSSVLYRAWDDKQRRDLVNGIIEEIASGESDWAVSMECLFRNYSYGMVDTVSGKKKVIARTKDSAFLTKHLRAYGGNGTYQNYRVYRVLENILFSGNALTKNPANPDSVILPPTKAEASTLTQPNRHNLALLLRGNRRRQNYRQYLR